MVANKWVKVTMNEISRNIFDMYLGDRKQSRWKGSLYSESICEKKKVSGTEGRPPRMVMSVLIRDILISSAQTSDHTGRLKMRRLVKC